MITRRRLAVTTAGILALTVTPSCTERRAEPAEDGANKLPDRTDFLRNAIREARDSGTPLHLEANARLAFNRVVDFTNVSVIGRGATLVWRGEHSPLAAIQLTGGSIENLNLRFATASNGRTAGIRVNATGSGEAARLRGLTIRGAPGSGIDVVGDPSAPVMATVQINECTVIESGHHGFDIRGVEGVVVRGGSVTQSHLAGIRAVSAPRIRIESVRSNNNGPGKKADGIVTLYTSEASIRACICRDNGGRGISIGGGRPDRAASQDWTLEGNVCTGNRSHGITVDPTILGQEGTPIPVSAIISRNTVTQNGGHGINVTCASGLAITANECSRNHGDGIAISSADVTVRSNKTERNGGNGIALYGSAERPRYGRHTVDGNDSNGNRRSDLTVSPYIAGSIRRG